jgi:flavin prenyltransferase
LSRRITVGVTGASGSIYALELIRALIEAGVEVDLIMTETGEKVLAYECAVGKEVFPANVKIHPNTNLFSSLASGSYRTGGMVVVPCSMNTLGLMAHGTGDSLLARAAQVNLKERRPLIVVPREMPYNLIFLENMLKLAQAGAIILPASPGFYHRPQTIKDLVDHVVGRIMDQLGIEHSLYHRWEGKTDKEE